MESIKRDIYLKRLIDREQNGLVKIITGIRRCGKSYLLNNLFYDYLKGKGIADSHIIKISLDDDENEDLLLPKALSRHIKSLIVDNDLYYILLDEVQLADNFVGVLNGLLKLPNVYLKMLTKIMIQRPFMEIQNGQRLIVNGWGQFGFLKILLQILSQN